MYLLKLQIHRYEENPDMPGNFTPSYSADCSHLSPGLRQTLRGNSMVEKKNLRD
jgi:hypothetical protein